MNKKADKLIYNEAKPSAFCNRQSTKMGTLTLSVLPPLAPILPMHKATSRFMQMVTKTLDQPYYKLTMASL